MQIFDFSTLTPLNLLTLSPWNSLGSTDPAIDPFSVVPASGSTITLHGPKVRGPFTRQPGRGETTSIHEKGFQMAIIDFAFKSKIIYNHFQFSEIIQVPSVALFINFSIFHVSLCY